ncbi:MAG TPA: 8-oxo-dGTP diphosphatase, partial [Clostridiaceae bacterium]|nr:8-oxo-dGTP diphosphatase [Clostridiaceae bacterium]
GAYLMLHRIKKRVDVNRGKWIGVGGKFETNESPVDCLLREVKEETGLILERFSYRGIITFIYNNRPAEYMHLYTADRFSGTLKPCDEGELAWIPLTELEQLNLWEGDRIFLRLLAEGYPPFSLKLVYHNDDLLEAVLDNTILVDKKGRFS